MCSYPTLIASVIYFQRCLTCMVLGHAFPWETGSRLVPLIESLSLHVVHNQAIITDRSGDFESLQSAIVYLIFTDFSLLKH